MRRALAAAAVLALALVGCTDDGQSPTSTTSSPPPTGETSTTPTSTTSDPADEPPALPDAAKSQTTAGAKAFVAHFGDVVNYAYLNLDPHAFATVSSATCQVCRLLTRDVASLARDGGEQTGGRWEVIRVAAVGNFEGTNLLLARIHISKGSVTESDSSPPKPIEASTVTDRFELTWDSGWRVKDIRAS